MKLSEELARKIEAHEAIVGVIGLGYVGLPLVREFCNAGFKVIGFDIDPKKVSMLKAGKSYIEHLPAEIFNPFIKDKRFSPTADMKLLSKPDAILICVPTPLDKMREPDMTFIRSTSEDIARRLRPGQLVILESTTYPGTTREVVQPLLDATGLRLDRDYFLAFSPEREDPGRKDYTTNNIPKVVGGATPASGKLAATLYGQALTTVVPVSSCEVAEACKILENVYRSVNIALVNELKLIFERMGIDVWEVIEAARTKPFGYQAFYPGPGLGGHCIPIDPLYLSWKARQYGRPTRFIELAAEINTFMPEYVVMRVSEALNERGRAVKGARILVLGLAYKKDVDDVRESPSVTLIELLRARGAIVDYHDPHIPSAKPMREHNITDMRSVPLTRANLKKYDCVLISTDHSSVDYDMVVEHSRLVVDTRNATGNKKRPAGRVVKA
ncbi:MAG: nucleotide sugar dehydrogenase [Phycisphaerae bacterium]|jgi:UDP-N-acetyl-D-glucosamine dehydrogenase|nr:nucleotide sugar dehydrogenase [Phycisphaerae bacterium]HOO15596.1 nucleotide sugar dehydrogenase [Phycisphaerae bacterium]HPC21034.1 nucleotide sugar dehydrogenase [Phycisphaerae bacterium]HRS26772.1 nucleotide sugar dehydrogenase [Phycisphaerae bacterium]HRT41763.1 nucleotide sugar dehydrogenase [Phycisphaerae bacterium]